MPTVETQADQAAPRRAPDNTTFMADLLRLVDMWKDQPQLPGPSNLGMVRVHASCPPVQLRAIAAGLGLDVSAVDAGCRMRNLQVDWQLDTIWVSFHATERDAAAAELPADPIRTAVARGSETVGPSIQDDDARDERLAHHRTRR